MPLTSRLAVLLQTTQEVHWLAILYSAMCKYSTGSSPCGAAETNPTRNHEVEGSIPGLAQWVKDLAMSCGVGHGRGSDLVLLWLWRRPAVAPAGAGPLAWGPLYAAGADLERQKKKERKKIQHWERWQFCQPQEKASPTHRGYSTRFQGARPLTPVCLPH